MSMTIMRRIKFCAGHRLFGHGGKCEFFHGHNYISDFYLTGSETDEVGRLVDFAEIKAAFKGWIDENWDHGFLLNEQDQNGIDAIRKVEPSKYFILPYNPTAENMARFLLEEVSPKLVQRLSTPGIFVSKVVIWETEESFAEAAISSRELQSNAFESNHQFSASNENSI